MHVCVGKVKPDRLKHRGKGGSLRVTGKTGQPQNSVMDAGETVDIKDMVSSVEPAQKESVACLTSEQLQQILNSVQTISNDKGPPEEDKLQLDSEGNMKHE